MNEEEKKAIEFLKVLKNLKISCSFFNDGKFEFNNEQKKQFDIILNLIEKQQKEIEELKEKNKENIKCIEEWINGERMSVHCIHKDRIRAIMEDLNEKIKNATEIEAILMIKQQQILQKVLEE